MNPPDARHLMGSDSAGPGAPPLRVAPKYRTAPHGVRAALIRCGFIAPALIVSITAIAASRSASYDPLGDTVSDLTAQDVPESLFLRLGIVAFGGLTVAFAAGLASALPRHGRVVQVLLSAFGVSVGFAGVFRDHSAVPETSRNWEGYFHNTFGLLAVASLLAAYLSLFAVTRQDPDWRSFRNANISSLAITLLSAVMFVRGPRGVEGLMELVLYSTALAWMVTLAWNAQAVQQADVGASRRQPYSEN